MNNTINLKLPKDFFKNYARGRPCQIRIARECGYGRCDPDETTVLCHVNMAGLKAMGSRAAGAPDLVAAWGCGTCHMLVDGSARPRGDAPIFHSWPRKLIKPWLDLMHLEGVSRTLNELVKAGVLPNP